MNKDPLENWKKSQELWKLVEAACRVSGCEKKAVMSHRRQQPACFIRQVVMALARQRGYSTEEIGQFFGCHATNIYHAIESARNAASTGGQLGRLARQIAKETNPIPRNYFPKAAPSALTSDERLL